MRDRIAWVEIHGWAGLGWVRINLDLIFWPSSELGVTIWRVEGGRRMRRGGEGRLRGT